LTSIFLNQCFFFVEEFGIMLNPEQTK